MIVVADAGPLNYLTLIGSANLLEPAYGRIVIPQTVAAELSAAGAASIVRALVAQPPHWLDVVPDPPTDEGLSGLDPGDRAAITLALRMQARRVLIDDSHGRVEAQRRGLLVTGTLGVMADGHRNGLVDFEMAVQRLGQTNFYMSPRLLASVRRTLGLPH